MCVCLAVFGVERSWSPFTALLAGRCADLYVVCVGHVCTAHECSVCSINRWLVGLQRKLRPNCVLCCCCAHRQLQRKWQTNKGLPAYVSFYRRGSSPTHAHKHAHKYTQTHSLEVTAMAGGFSCPFTLLHHEQGLGQNHTLKFCTQFCTIFRDTHTPYTLCTVRMPCPPVQTHNKFWPTLIIYEYMSHAGYPHRCVQTRVWLWSKLAINQPCRMLLAAPERSSALLKSRKSGPCQ